MDTELMTLEEMQAFCDELKAAGLQTFAFRWGITEAALVRDCGPPVREIRGSGTDSRAAAYRLEDGSIFWLVDLYGPDDPEGIAWFHSSFVLGPEAVTSRAEEIERWLRENPDAYEVFVPILWRAAPDRAREARDWMDRNRVRWQTSPLADMYHDLYAELSAAIDGAH